MTLSINVVGRKGLQRIGVTLAEVTGQKWIYVIEVMIYPIASFSVANNTLRFPVVEPNAKIETDIHFDVFSSAQQLLPNSVDIKPSAEWLKLRLSGDPVLEQLEFE